MDCCLLFPSAQQSIWGVVLSSALVMIWLKLRDILRVCWVLSLKSKYCLVFIKVNTHTDAGSSAHQSQSVFAPEVCVVVSVFVYHVPSHTCNHWGARHIREVKITSWQMLIEFPSLRISSCGRFTSNCRRCSRLWLEWPRFTLFVFYYYESPSHRGTIESTQRDIITVITQPEIHPAGLLAW